MSDEIQRSPGESLRDWSVRWENAEGWDSIPTIETHYRARDRYGNDLDVFECVFPGCDWRSRDAEKMWRHVHEGPKHAH